MKLLNVLTVFIWDLHLFETGCQKRAGFGRPAPFSVIINSLRLCFSSYLNFYTDLCAELQIIIFEA